MSSSQELAGVAAIEALGFSAEMEVVEATGEAAARVFEPGDILKRINGIALDDFDHLLGVLGAIAPGSTIEAEIRRDGSPQTVTMVTEDDGEGGSRMGVIVGFALPFEVTFGVEGIGGSSAGMMFALGIVDKLGPVDLAGGHIVAGTGTIDQDGRVGAIGGIQQKMIGAYRDGAEYFLAPTDNCDQVRGAIPSGLKVTRVATLDEALNALAAIRAGEPDTLPTCESVSDR
jgi:PDZ domain-containing protein